MNAHAVVVTPTVPQRAGTREATLGQWRALGLEVIVVEQDPALPLGHRSQLATARRALTAGLEHGAPVVVYAEDDIDLDPRIPRVLPAALGRGPCSLWHRPRFRPAGVPGRGPDQVLVVPARAAGRWWGAQCLVLGRACAETLVCAEYGRGGIDMGVRLLPGLRITVPPLVAHRGVPRAATRGRPVDCDGYEGPRCGGLWC